MPQDRRSASRPYLNMGVPTRLRQREIVILSGRPFSPATKPVTDRLRVFVGRPPSLFSAWVSHHNTNSA